MPDEVSSGLRREKKPLNRKKGGGPAPARHIPWPEIFKHHISVVEGHSKMLEMVQKHTVQGTGTYDTISNLVNRGHDMLRQAKDMSRIFVPAAGDRDKVPLGSKSDTMYPGYSPAHVTYDEASSEFGKAVGSLRQQGQDWKPPADGPEFVVGQGKGSKRVEKKVEKMEKVVEDGLVGGRVEIKTVKAATQKSEPEEEGDNQYFVIDTNPTPVITAGVKRSAETEDEGEGEGEEETGGERKKSKKEKKEKKEKKKTGEAEQPVAVETEDITAEVDAKLKAKHKKESKRRRESGGDEEEKVVKKSKKDKKDKSKKRDGSDGENEDGEGKKKKRKKSAE
ncbi:MAG: hypothetical protein M1818_006831 [Claussenomyces sp. TS43310]|nr:MAG: hypothetical protein M1818_006831 [Claussenomyces sp. TS43310]